MHKTNCSKDQDIDTWEKNEVERVANKLTTAETFQRYVKSKSLAKIEMWVVGNQNLPYVGHDTNAMIENYYANLKATLRSLKGRFHKRWVDQAIHAL